MRSTWFCPLSHSLAVGRCCCDCSVSILTCVRVCTVYTVYTNVVNYCGRILFSVLYILSPSESWSYLTILSILLSFSVVKSTSGGRNHLKSHARAAFCFVQTQNFVVFWRRMQTDRQTNRQTDRQSYKSEHWDKICIQTNIDKYRPDVLWLIMMKRLLI